MTYKLRKLKSKGLASLGFGLAMITAAVTGSTSVANAEEKNVSFQKGDQVDIQESIKGFFNSKDALAGKNQKVSYRPGDYFIYKQVEGAVNITRKKGVPGAWVKTADLKLETKKTNEKTDRAESTKKTGDKITVKDTIKGYISSKDALAGRNQKVSYKAGEYFIFKEVDGAVNITRKKGVPGAWVKSSDLKFEEKVEKEEKLKQEETPKKPETTKETLDKPTDGASEPETKETGDEDVASEKETKTEPLKVGDQIIIEGGTKRFKNAKAAEAQENSVGEYKEGKFYVYKIYGNGVYNLSKVKGQPGSWVKLGKQVKDVEDSYEFTSEPTGDRKKGKSHSVEHFQFMDLRSKTAYSAEELNKVLARFGGENSLLYGKGHVFKQAEKEFKINALYLMAHAALESGWGKSVIARDKYNFFGIAAYDNSPYQSAYSYNGVDKGIMDGGKWIAGRYIHGSGFPFDGPYLGNKSEGMNKYYATDPRWGSSIARIMKTADDMLGNLR